MWKAIREKEPFFISIFRSRNDHQGFTLVEIMIVIALVVVLATIAIPITLRSRVQSNEAATIANLRTVSSACESYRTTQNPASYPSDLTALINSNPPYLDAAWATPNRQGYVYTYISAGDGETYSTGAMPRSPNISGVNSYCVDQTAIIRRYTGAPANYGTAVGCDPRGDPA